MSAERRSTKSSEQDSSFSQNSQSENAFAGSTSHDIRRQSVDTGTCPESPRPRPLATPSTSIPPSHSLLPSAPASPPTPAPSPTPHQRSLSRNQRCMSDEEDAFLQQSKQLFSALGKGEQERFLVGLLNSCDRQRLSFVHEIVCSRLKRDPFQMFPNELCLRVLSFIDDPKTLARAAQVSVRWHELLSDDITWKLLCDKHAYRRTSSDNRDSLPMSAPPSESFHPPTLDMNDAPPLSSSTANLLSTPSKAAEQMTRMRARRSRSTSYRAHFKKKYLVDTAWKKGGSVTSRNITGDQMVVTSLHLTPKHILIALDNARIHVLGPTGEHQRVLQGHVMGVWAMVPSGDILVSGGCDRDVRVWDIETGNCLHKLRGHTSTVRCLKMVDKTTAISGSRDATLRIWDISAGVCKNVLAGHQASVRCLDVHGDLVVSGSYDTTAKIWSISEARCLRTLSGHFSQIYAVAFDGKRIATGSLDTSVRIWSPNSNQCLAVLQGHTSLVGQLQLRGDTLVTGGSDGSIRVWSLERNGPIHRLAAHDNSITSLQFNHNRIVSGGNDGRVKIWDLQTGQLIRELGQPADSVWRIAFQEERAVVMATRLGRIVMEVWNFSPPADDASPKDDSATSTDTPTPSRATVSTGQLRESNFAQPFTEVQDLDMQDVFTDPEN